MPGHPESHPPLKPLQYLLLLALSSGDLHGYGLRKDILQRTDGVVIRPRGGSYQSVTIASTPQNIERLIAARATGRLTLVLKGKPGQ